MENDTILALMTFVAVLGIVFLVKKVGDRNREIDAMSRRDTGTSNDGARADVQGVTITHIDIPFGEIFKIMFQVGIAAVPVGVVLAIVWSVVVAILAGMGIAISQ